MAEKELSDVEKVMRINKHALNSKGQLKSFTEQYGEYAFVKETVLDAGIDLTKNNRALEGATPFVLAMNGSVFGIPEMEDKPLTISNKALKHIRSRHLRDLPDPAEAIGFLNSLIDNLSNEMARNVLVFQDDLIDNHLVFALREKSENGNPITTIVEVDNNSRGVTVDSIVSNHARDDLLEKIGRSVALGKKIHVNERTGAWLLAQMTEPPAESGRATTRDLERPGETGLPAGRLAAIRRLSEEYCRKFPDTEASRELRKAALGSEMEILPGAPWDYLSSALGEVDEDVNVEILGGDTSDYGHSVPWYVREAWERNEMTDELPCSSYIAIREGEYGIVHKIDVERGDTFAEVECLGGYNAAKAAFVEVAGEFARDHPMLECALAEELGKSFLANPLSTRVTLGVFTPWNMDSTENERVARDLCACYDRVVERSRTILPPNLIELKGSRPEGHQILTDSTGEEPTYLTGPDMHLAEVIDGKLEDLPDEAQRAWCRQGSHDLGPTTYLYEIRTWDEHRGTQTTYGSLSEIYMEDDPETGMSHIDRFDEFEAPTEVAHRALDEVARRFAWEHSDVTVLSGSPQYNWPAQYNWPDAPDLLSRTFEVFTPISVTDDRYEEIFWDQDTCFATIERRCREMEAEMVAQGISDKELGSDEPEKDWSDGR